MDWICSGANCAIGGVCGKCCNKSGIDNHHDKTPSIRIRVERTAGEFKVALEPPRVLDHVLPESFAIVRIQIGRAHV